MYVYCKAFIVLCNSTCIKLHDQIDSVRKTNIGSLAIVLSLNESKNSIISAAVPETCTKKGY